MNIITIDHDKHYSLDLSRPLDISIPLKNGMDNPNCYFASPVKFQTIRSGSFTGSVAEGGPVNHQMIQITPHGNGTHTECYGHICADKEATLNRCLTRFHFIAQVLTIAPRQAGSNEEMLYFEDFVTGIENNIEAIVIRTLPNNEEKLRRQYSGTNPPYLDVRIADYLRKKNVDHLLIDLPSVDPEDDGGALKAHKSFWNVGGNIRRKSTITELIYVTNEIPDGLYLLNLQITSLEADASPSKPVLYKLVSTGF